MAADEMGAAWRELLDHVGHLDRTFLEGDRAVGGTRLETAGYRFLATILGVALDIFVFADPARPQFVDLNAPDRPDRWWGGDNTDASYRFCAVDPSGTYRISGHRGDSVYFSVTIYNEPAPGQWSDRVVGIVNDADLTFGPDGEFDMLAGPVRPDGWDGPFVQLTPDAAHIVTRDYQAIYDAERRTRFAIEVVDPPDVTLGADERLAAGMAAAKVWIDQQFQIVPMPVAGRGRDALTEGHIGPGTPNQVAEPYQVTDTNFGWSARDACYAFGTFDLRADEALVITHRPPICRFWNLNLWDPFMAKFDFRDGRVSINAETAEANPDGTVTVVIARRAVDHPNALTTLDHDRGMIAFRWFLAEEVPERPESYITALMPRAAKPFSS